LLLLTQLESLLEARRRRPTLALIEQTLPEVLKGKVAEIRGRRSLARLFKRAPKEAFCDSEGISAAVRLAEPDERNHARSVVT
jgi:hypothetical protein